MQALVKPISYCTLKTLPASLRLLFSVFLLTIGAGYLAALFYLFLVDVDPHKRMGMGLVEGITMKYHGVRGNTRLESALRGIMANKINLFETEEVLHWINAGASTEEYQEKVKPLLDKNCVICHNAKSNPTLPMLTTFEEVREVARVDTGPGLDQLARVSHVHLFGISIIFLLTGMIFSLSEITSTLKLPIIVMSYVAIWMDIGSWWITKYQPFFAYTVIIGGGFMGLALAAQILISLWEMWFKKASATPIDTPTQHASDQE
jgi:hypothetical protein